MNEMGVRVDEAWQDCAPMKINGFRERAGERAHIGVVAGRQDAPRSQVNRQSRDARRLLVHRMDDAVDQQKYRTVGQWHGALLQGDRMVARGGGRNGGAL